MEGFLSLFSLVVFSVGTVICLDPRASLSKDGSTLVFPKDPTMDPSEWDIVTRDARGLAVATSVVTLLVVLPQ
jgi:hypothetical protein